MTIPMDGPIDDIPETGPCGRCGKPGRYAGGCVDDDGRDVFVFFCNACDATITKENFMQACLDAKATRH